MSRRLGTIGAWIVLLAAITAAGYLLIVTTLMPYDDEGFLLVSIRNYLAGSRLYDDVFSQYGPWPYVYHQVVTTLCHAPMTHLFGRALTLLHWVAMSGLCGAIAWRLTRSHVAGIFATAAVFTLTWQNTSEPSHPGSHIGLLVAVAGLAILAAGATPRTALPRVWLGLVSALLLLTKINVGLLLVAAWGAWELRYTEWPARRRFLGTLGVTGVLLVPWLLLGRQLGQPWALTFAAVFTTAVAGFLWASPPRGQRFGGVAWPQAAGIAVAAIAVVVICGWVLLRGTTPGALVSAVLLNPLRMPARFIVPLHWYPPTLWVTAASAMVLGVAGWDWRRRGRLGSLASGGLVGLRLVGVGAFAAHLLAWPSYYGIFHFASYCLPALAAFAVPLRAAESAETRRQCAGVTLVALLQVLHAFPVAGSQLAWGTFLCVPVLTFGTWEMGRALRERFAALPRWLPWVARLLPLGAAATLLLLVGRTGWERYTTSRPLGLPGAEALRVDDATRAGFRLLALNSAIHADLLFSRQGMYSHNLWSGVPTPTTQNATHWFWLLDDARQQAIIARLAATPRTAVITSGALDQVLANLKVPVTGPLARFIEEHYRELFAYADFHFHVPRDSTATVFGRYDAHEAGDAANAEFPLLFTSQVLLDGQVATIGLESMRYPWPAGPALLTPATRVLAQPIDRTGRAVGAAVTLPGDQPLRGLFRLSIYTPRLPAALPWQECMIVTRDPSGAVLSESVY